MSTDCRMNSCRAYKREADAVNAAIEEKRDAVPEPEPVAAAAPEPEPTNYGSYSGYGGFPSLLKASLNFLILTRLRNLSSCRQLFRIWVRVPLVLDVNQ